MYVHIKHICNPSSISFIIYCVNPWLESKFLPWICDSDTPPCSCNLEIRLICVVIKMMQLLCIKKRGPWAHGVGGLVRPTANLEIMVKRKIPVPPEYQATYKQTVKEIITVFILCMFKRLTCVFMLCILTIPKCAILWFVYELHYNISML
jgi:hypothetical protein